MNVVTSDKVTFANVMQIELSDSCIKKLADALKQKTGKWIGNEFGECSACGHKGCASDIWDRCEKHYCPNCGTLLEEEQ